MHPPRLVMTIRDAADQWSKGATVIPARPGWADTMPGLGTSAAAWEVAGGRPPAESAQPREPEADEPRQAEGH